MCHVKLVPKELNINGMEKAKPSNKNDKRRYGLSPQSLYIKAGEFFLIMKEEK